MFFFILVSRDYGCRSSLNGERVGVGEEFLSYVLFVLFRGSRLGLELRSYICFGSFLFISWFLGFRFYFFVLVYLGLSFEEGVSNLCNLYILYL